MLIEHFLIVEESNFITPSGELTAKMKQIESVIELLAKVSGNEELFLLEIKRY